MRIASLFWIFGLAMQLGCGASPGPSANRTEPSASESVVESTGPSATPPSPSNSSQPSTAPPASEPSHTAAETAGSDGQLALERLAFKVPAAWVRKEASSSFLLAEFTLPKPDGADSDGRLTVSVAGGSIEANVGRWRDQFGGKPQKSSEELKQISGLEITLVDFSGEFNDQRGPLAPASKRSGYRMLAAVIPVDGELHFVKATGPEATIAAHAESFHQFLASVVKK